MPSSISWLDYSEAQQKQLRELIGLFSESGTLDDLGIGTIRDAISNSLFPGTSTIQTRSRYFLFIPWIFGHAEREHPRNLVAKAADMERLLISALKTGGEDSGVIGARVGASVKTLPSAIHWSGLVRYGIFSQPHVTIRQYGRRFAAGPSSAEAEDERVDRSFTFWNRAIPDPPEDFFDFKQADFEMSHDEATWIAERIGSSAGPAQGQSLLSSYLGDRRSISDVKQSDFFWDAPTPARTPEAVKQLVGHAQMFSCAVQGATTLYNMMLAENRLKLDPPPTSDDELVSPEYWRSELESWRDHAAALRLQEWAQDVQEFRESLVENAGPPSNAFNNFVAPWARALSEDLEIWNSSSARSCVFNRERSTKKSQARFNSDKRLRAWSGNTGTGRLDFRWSQVKTMLTDISQGFESGPGGDSSARA